jgi:alpha-L-fucosidase 2
MEALPVGNGRMGAMVFGGVFTERIQLNEESLWEGDKHDAANPASAKALPEVQRLMFEGKNDSAEELASRTMMGIPERIRPLSIVRRFIYRTPPTNRRYALHQLPPLVKP